MKKGEWIKESETTTEEFRVEVGGGRALCLAAQQQVKGDHFVVITILKGLGMKVSYTSIVKFVFRKNNVFLSPETDDYVEVDTVYAEIAKN